MLLLGYEMKKLMSHHVSRDVKWLPWQLPQLPPFSWLQKYQECFTRILQKKWRETWTVKQNVGCLGCIMDQKPSLFNRYCSIKSPIKKPKDRTSGMEISMIFHVTRSFCFFCGEKMDVWNMGEHLKRGGLNSNEPIKLGIKVDNPDPMSITYVNMSPMSYCHVGLWMHGYHGCPKTSFGMFDQWGTPKKSTCFLNIAFDDTVYFQVIWYSIWEKCNCHSDDVYLTFYWFNWFTDICGLYKCFTKIVVVIDTLDPRGLEWFYYARIC